MPIERKNAYGYNDILAAARGDLFGEGYARLPAPPMLMLDCVTKIASSGGAFDRGHARAEFYIRPDLWFFDCHFKHDPLMPGALGIEALWQLAGFYLAWYGCAGEARAIGGTIRFIDRIDDLTEVVEFGIDVRRIGRAGLGLVVANGWARADGRLAYTASDIRVACLPPGGPRRLERSPMPHVEDRRSWDNARNPSAVP